MIRALPALLLSPLLLVPSVHARGGGGDPSLENFRNGAKGRFRDPRDSKEYPVIRLAGLTWFAQNLAYRAKGSWCYGNDKSNCNEKGRLYNWITAQKACPDGWHLPEKADWEALQKSLGGEDRAGEALKAVASWPTSKDDGGFFGWGKTEPSGFEAKPSGYRSAEGKFEYGSESASWWSGTASNLKDAAWNAGVSSQSKSLVLWDGALKRNGNAVRCVAASDTVVTKSVFDAAKLAKVEAPVRGASSRQTEPTARQAESTMPSRKAAPKHTLLDAFTISVTVDVEDELLRTGVLRDISQRSIRRKIHGTASAVRCAEDGAYGYCIYSEGKGKAAVKSPEPAVLVRDASSDSWVLPTEEEYLAAPDHNRTWVEVKCGTKKAATKVAKPKVSSLKSSKPAQAPAPRPVEKASAPAVKIK